MKSQKENLSLFNKSNAILTEVNRKYSALISNLQGIVYRCRNDRDWTMEYISEACLSITGHSPQAFLEGKIRWGWLIEPEDRGLVWNDIQKAITEKRPFDLSFRIRDKMGNIKYLRESGHPVFDKNGNFEALEGIITDFTKEKKVAFELAREKEMLEKYINTSASVFVVINRAQKIELINQKGCEILGWPRHEIVNKNWFESFLPKKDKRKIAALFNEIMQGTIEPPEIANVIITKSKERKLIQWRGRTLKDDNGKVIALLLSGNDITEQHNVNKELDKSKKQLEQYAQQLEERVEERTREVGDTVQKLVEANISLEDQVQTTKAAEKMALESQTLIASVAKNFPKGIIMVFNIDMELVMIGGEELNKSRLSKSDFEGKSIDNFPIFSNKRKQKIKENVLKTFNGQHLSFETDYDENTYAGNSIPLIVNKKIAWALFVYSNITKQKLAERNMKDALKKEQELNELKSRFISMASHEFRTPLTAILSAATLIGKLNQPSKQERREKYVKQIESNVQNLVVILNDFLSLAKLEEGKSTFHPESLDIVQLAKLVLAEIETSKKEGQKITLIHDRPTILVTLDAKLIRHILVNLVSNAIKYSAENTKVDITITSRNNKASIQVSDQGIGIPPEEHDNLFNRFFRAKNAVNIQGTGLGLHIVKQYTELMGGTVSFISNVEKGTTFFVEFKAS